MSDLPEALTRQLTHCAHAEHIENQLRCLTSGRVEDFLVLIDTELNPDDGVCQLVDVVIRTGNVLLAWSGRERRDGRSVGFHSTTKVVPLAKIVDVSVTTDIDDVQAAKPGPDLVLVTVATSSGSDVDLQLLRSSSFDEDSTEDCSDFIGQLHPTGIEMLEDARSSSHDRAGDVLAFSARLIDALPG